jgi:hypothetical protein
VPTDTLSFWSRFALALASFFRILSDPAFAALVLGAKEPAAPKELPRSPEPSAKAARPPSDGALLLLALFQREGRLVDFLGQDVESFSDTDIGAAARVVHAGCRRAFRSHFDVGHVRDEREGSAVTVEAGDLRAVTLTGNVSGSPPHRGTLRHGGWRATAVRLPEMLPDHDATLLCPAEVEL